MTNTMKNSDGSLNRDYWNVVKGIGIVCIVIGHGVMPIQNFVYLFHVPLFFFLSGYFYSEEKYGDAPFSNLEARMGLWIKYIIMYGGFVLCHNFFLRADMLRQGETMYTWRDIFTKIAYVMVGCGDELLAGPLWFVPALVMGSVILGLIVSASRYLERRCGFVLVKFLFQFIVVIGLSVVGYKMAYNNINPPAHMRVVLMVLPYFEIGYLLRNYVPDLEGKLHLWMSLLLFLFLCIYSREHLFNLVDEYVSPFMNLTAVAGIYVCLEIAKQICLSSKGGKIRDLMVYLGRASFAIMGLHFLIIRLIDRIYAAKVGDVSIMYHAYLGNHNTLIPLYLLLGIGIPVVLKKMLDWMTKKWD